MRLYYGADYADIIADSTADVLDAAARLVAEHTPNIHPDRLPLGCKLGARILHGGVGQVGKRLTIGPSPAGGDGDGHISPDAYSPSLARNVETATPKKNYYGATIDRHSGVVLSGAEATTTSTRSPATTHPHHHHSYSSSSSSSSSSSYASPSAPRRIRGPSATATTMPPPPSGLSEGYDYSQTCQLLLSRSYQRPSQLVTFRSVLEVVLLRYEAGKGFEMFLREDLKFIGGGGDGGVGGGKGSAIPASSSFCSGGPIAAIRNKAVATSLSAGNGDHFSKNSIFSLRLQQQQQQQQQRPSSSSSAYPYSSSRINACDQREEGGAALSSSPLALRGRFEETTRQNVGRSSDTNNNTIAVKFPTNPNHNPTFISDYIGDEEERRRLVERNYDLQRVLLDAGALGGGEGGTQRREDEEEEGWNGTVGTKRASSSSPVAPNIASADDHRRRSQIPRRSGQQGTHNEGGTHTNNGGAADNDDDGRCTVVRFENDDGNDGRRCSSPVFAGRPTSSSRLDNALHAAASTVGYSGDKYHHLHHLDADKTKQSNTTSLFATLTDSKSPPPSPAAALLQQQRSNLNGRRSIGNSNTTFNNNDIDTKGLISVLCEFNPPVITIVGSVNEAITAALELAIFAKCVAPTAQAKYYEEQYGFGLVSRYEKYMARIGEEASQNQNRDNSSNNNNNNNGGDPQFTTTTTTDFSPTRQSYKHNSANRPRFVDIAVERTLRVQRLSLPHHHFDDVQQGVLYVVIADIMEWAAKQGIGGGGGGGHVGGGTADGALSASASTETPAFGFEKGSDTMHAYSSSSSCCGRRRPSDLSTLAPPPPPKTKRVAAAGAGGSFYYKMVPFDGETSILHNIVKQSMINHQRAIKGPQGRFADSELTTLEPYKHSCELLFIPTPL